MGELPAQRPRAQLAGAAEHRRRRRRWRARGRTRRACRARRGSARPSAWVSASLRKPACASPDVEQRLRARRPAGRARRPRPRRRRSRSCRRRCRRGARWWRGRPCECADTRVLRMPNTVILGAARTPVGKLGGGLSSLQATELGGIAIEAALERAGRRAGPGPARRDGPGAAGRPGPDPLAPGADRGGDPEGGLLRDDQQGLRLGRARGRHPRHRDPRRRPRGRASAAAWSRCPTRPTCCRRRASASAWATPRRSTR